ncbi:MAG: hypothetical protein JWL73_3878, partial [Actinomycetia bacterium]|nr:hypothetical protein [Actinomycetes bacterium]
MSVEPAAATDRPRPGPPLYHRHRWGPLVEVTGRRAERGQALLLVIGVLVLACALCLAVVRIGVAAGERARAETAA